MTTDSKHDVRTAAPAAPLAREPLARALRLGPALGIALLVAAPARAADIDGAALSGWWAVPFVGILLSIALFPLLAPRIWHFHYGKIAFAWALAFFAPFAAFFGGATALTSLVHVMLAEYLPFIILLSALFTVAGGIYVRGNLHGSPGLNVVLMVIGAVLASFMGTTGASMLMIRPLLRANDNRRSVAHVVVFFIFIVSNAGGALTPLGDPPLFLGFLKGVDFFWTLHLLPHTLFLIAALLVVFFVIDRHHYVKEGVTRVDPTPDTPTFGLDGKFNLLLLLAIMGLVLMSGSWKSGVAWNVMGTELGLPQVVRDVALVGVVLLSMATTKRAVREANEYSIGPMVEVAKLFFGIFLTIIPVIAMLRAGTGGAFAPIVALVNDGQGQPIPLMYFWASGLLSSFLDNAPTYLVFFNLAGGDPQVLMTTLAPVLIAISAGSVFMGANSYIGNAPNLMVKAVAEQRGVRMPGFFGYMGWSIAVLIPLFLLVSAIWFR